ncbi:MAG: MOSC N-terminal beta barrel domain-containing protein [Gammaproteobacteria bacterium]|nr:MOSC N-terminal beta barrel domain-containing protein [Gammaproteobacteria bacterium]
MVTLHSLHLYPLKSARGIDLGHARLAATGLDGDRRWMVISAAGRFLTQREQPRLALLRTALQGAALRLSAPGLPDITLAGDAAGSARTVRVWNDECDGIDAGDDAADWVSQVIGMPCRVLRFDPRRTRLSAMQWTRGIAAPNQFSDGFPLLVANRASLAALNGQLDTPLPMNRFRPNLVLDGLAPWDEDRIDELHIGAVHLRLVKPSTRCIITTIDQDSATPTGEEPLRTLRACRYDAVLRGVLFGVNAIILAGVGTTLSAGTAVQVRWK